MLSFAGGPTHWSATFCRQTLQSTRMARMASLARWQHRWTAACCTHRMIRHAPAPSAKRFAAHLACKCRPGHVLTLDTSY